MLMQEERAQVVKFGKKMAACGLTSGTGGNLSMMDRENDLVAITPSGLDYDEMLREDVVVVSLSGEVVEGDRRPSSELSFHLALYERRKDISAVIHTHSTYAVVMACLHMEIPAVHYLVGFAGKKVPVAPYATFGTEALASSVVDAIGDSNAVLMANHGLVAVGPDMSRAFTVAEEIEFTAKVYHHTLAVGKPVILPDDEMEMIIEKFKGYGRQ